MAGVDGIEPPTIGFKGRRSTAELHREEEKMIPVQVHDGSWQIVREDGSVAKTGLQSNAAAWRWIDQQSDDDLAMEDRRRRISAAFSE